MSGNSSIVCTFIARTVGGLSIGKSRQATPSNPASTAAASGSARMSSAVVPCSVNVDHGTQPHSTSRTLLRRVSAMVSSSTPVNTAKVMTASSESSIRNPTANAVHDIGPLIVLTVSSAATKFLELVTGSPRDLACREVAELGAARRRSATRSGTSGDRLVRVVAGVAYQRVAVLGARTGRSHSSVMGRLSWWLPWRKSASGGIFLLQCRGVGVQVPVQAAAGVGGVAVGDVDRVDGLPATGAGSGRE